MAGAQPTSKLALGIAKEAVRGTGVLPTHFIPVGAIEARRIITQLDDESMRGSAAQDYGQVQGPWRSELSIPGDVYSDTFGWFLSSMLGDLTTTGAGAPFTHAFSLLNSTDQQPMSKTLTDFYVANARQYPYCMCTELTVRYNADGKLSYESTWLGRAEATAAAPTTAYTALEIMPGYKGIVTIAAATPLLLSAEITMSRNGDAINVANNSQDPNQVFVGPIRVQGRVGLILEDDTYITQYTSGSAQIFDIQFDRGAAAATEQVKFHCTNTKWREGGNPIRDRDYIRAELLFRAFANTTDVGASGGLSPVKATLKNAIAASIYQ